MAVDKNTLFNAEVRADIDRSKKLLEDLTGRAVRGYRAPSFSIDARSLWAFDVLSGQGIEYDSSVHTRRPTRIV